MKKTLLIIASLLFITSTVIPQSKMNINNLVEYGGKKYKPNVDKPYTGLVFDLYRTTGNKSLEGRYKDGLKNGKWEWWSENGKMDSTGQYTHGKKNGEWIINKYKDHPFKFVLTYDDGKISGSEFAIDSLGNKYILKNSLVHNEGLKYEKNIKTPYTGPVMEQWYNGKIKLIGYYKDGLRDGNWEFWFDIGWDDYSSTFKTMAGEYKDGTAINWVITTDPEKNILEKFDLTVTSNETKGIVKSNSGELIIDDSWVRIKVYAQQFAWNIHYTGQDGKFGETKLYLIDDVYNPIGLDRNSTYGADDIYTINELVLPVNTNVLLEVTTKATYAGVAIEDLSQYKDIMDELYHILLIPELNLLQEARINVWNNIKINVKETGNYTMRCVHYCGIGAYRHKGFVTITEKESYQAWLEEEKLYLEENSDVDDWGDDDW